MRKDRFREVMNTNKVSKRRFKIYRMWIEGRDRKGRTCMEKEIYR